MGRAEGALVGPASYLRSRHWLRQQNRAFSMGEWMDQDGTNLDLGPGTLK